MSHCDCCRLRSSPVASILRAPVGASYGRHKLGQEGQESNFLDRFCHRLLRDYKRVETRGCTEGQKGVGERRRQFFYMQPTYGAHVGDSSS